MATTPALEASLAAFVQTIEDETTEVDIAKTKNSMNGYKGIVKIKISDLVTLRENLRDALAADPPNPEAVARFSQDLVDGRKELLVAKTK